MRRDPIGLQGRRDADPRERAGAIKKTDIPASDNPLGVPIKFKADGDLAGRSSATCSTSTTSGKYVQIPTK